MKLKIYAFLTVLLITLNTYSQQSWNISGNSNTTNTDFLGTIGQQDLLFKTNSQNRMSISSAGNFSFNGKYFFDGNLLNSNLFTISNSRTGGALNIGQNPPAYSDFFTIQTLWTNAVTVNGQPGITPHFKVAADGNVGINVEKPQASLHVHNGLIRVTGKNYAGGPMIIFGGDYQAKSGDWGIEYAKSTSKPTLSGLNFWKPSGSNHFGNYYLFLADNGNVGIGTDNPGSFKLAVEGTIGAREVTVTLTNPWPDYVFDSNYNRPSLYAVENYIKDNKHLPGVKSASELKESNGVDLGKMQSKQMEKLEELYLYVIDLKKEIDVLKVENEKLKSKAKFRK